MFLAGLYTGAVFPFVNVIARDDLKASPELLAFISASPFPRRYPMRKLYLALFLSFLAACSGGCRMFCDDYCRCHYPPPAVAPH